MNVLSLFDGISCGQLALLQAGVRVDNYYASEIDKKAICVTQRHFPNTIQLGDVTNWRYWNLPKIDLLIAGSPCQGFSSAGKQLNFNDPRSKLFFDFVDIKNYYSPNWWFLENVKMKQEYSIKIDEILETDHVQINSSLVSAQNRVRNYWANFSLFPPEDQNIELEKIIGGYESIFVLARGANKGGFKGYNKKSPCITTSSWEHNFLIFDGERKRKFSPEEAEALQTLPNGYTSCLSSSQRFKVIGNGWTVKLIEHFIRTGLLPKVL